MKYEIFEVSHWWSTKKLKKLAEDLMNQKAIEGWMVVAVSYGTNFNGLPTFFITMTKANL